MCHIVHLLSDTINTGLKQSLCFVVVFCCSPLVISVVNEPFTSVILVPKQVFMVNDFKYFCPSPTPVFKDGCRKDYNVRIIRLGVETGIFGFHSMSHAN